MGKVYFCLNYFNKKRNKIINKIKTNYENNALNKKNILFIDNEI